MPIRREYTFTRSFAAPRRIVFGAWTDPRQLAEWWGPDGFTAPRCEFDARPGGAIHIDMRAPDGTVHPMGGRVRSLREPEKLVFVSAALDADGKPIFEVLNTVTLTERGGRTTLTVKARVLRKTPDADRYLKGMEEGWKLTLDRMQAFSTNPARQITLSRVFDAPVARVWEAFTDPKQTPLWWGPDGFTITSRSRKVKAGGSWDFIMHGPDGTDYPNFITYKEVVRHKRLVYEHGDEKGKAPEFVSTATFEKQGKKTRVTMTAVFSTTAIREFVAKEHHAVEGGQQTLGRLAEHLAKQG